MCTDLTKHLEFVLAHLTYFFHLSYVRGGLKMLFNLMYSKIQIFVLGYRASPF